MRGDGRVFPKKGSTIWHCAYYLHGKEIRESTGETTEAKALKYLQHRIRDVENDRDGIKQFVGPQAERIRIACGVIAADERKPDCDCLCCALERDLRLRSKLDAPALSLLKRLHTDFARRFAVRLTSEQIDAYITRRLAKGAANATVNRITQMLGQAIKLAIRQKRLTTAPYIRHLSETGNVRQGFYTNSDYEAIVSGLPDYLKDFARFGYLTGMRKNQIAMLLWEDIDGDVIRSRAENVKKRKPHSIQFDDDDMRELMERRRAARRVAKADGTLVLSRWVFHLNSHPIGDIRKAWQTACVMAGLGRFLCRDCEVTLDAGRQCPSCGKKWNQKVQPKYEGKLFHDFRRTAVRDMVRAGISQSVAMSISGHSTDSMFRRYDIVDGRDQREALRAVKQYREQQAQSERQELTNMPATVQ